MLIIEHKLCVTLNFKLRNIFHSYFCQNFHIGTYIVGLVKGRRVVEKWHQRRRRRLQSCVRRCRRRRCLHRGIGRRRHHRHLEGLVLDRGLEKFRNVEENREDEHRDEVLGHPVLHGVGVVQVLE